MHDYNINYKTYPTTVRGQVNPPKKSLKQLLRCTYVIIVKTVAIIIIITQFTSN